MSFIQTLAENDYKKIREERVPIKRENNIGWPSEASSKLDNNFNTGSCGRELFYRILGHPYSNVRSRRVSLMADAGTLFENDAVMKFKESGLFVEAQKRVFIDLPNTVNKITISGKVDIIINENNVLKAIEIKTVYGFSADTIFGGRDKKKIPLPKPSNLMQAILYKDYFNKNEKDGIKEVYLMYINRGDGSTIFFKVDIDKEGYPILTIINSEGKELKVIKLQECKSYEDLIKKSTISTSEESRLAELRININDIFKKYDEIFTYARKETIPPKDYQTVWDEKRAELEYRVGRISKIKYNSFKRDKEPIGDSRCSFCLYRMKCGEDSGIKLK